MPIPSCTDCLPYIGRGDKTHDNGRDRLKRIKFVSAIIIGISAGGVAISIILVFLAIAGHLHSTIPIINRTAPALHPLIPLSAFFATSIFFLASIMVLNCYRNWIRDNHGITKKDEKTWAKEEKELKKSPEEDGSGSDSSDLDSTESEED